MTFPSARWRLARLARNAAGALLVFAIFYAPWDYGATSASAIRHLNRLLGAMALLWLIGTVLRPRREEGSGERKKFWSWTFLALSALLLLLGWAMTWNAQALFDSDYGIFMPLSAPRPQAPGSADYALSVATMWRVTALLGCVWVVADFAQDAKWLLRIWWAIGLAGGSIALLGLIQKATGAEMIFWETTDPGEPAISTFFATFYYHGNAGAFLNLALPAVLGLAFRYLRRRANPGARALWLTLSLIMIVAVISDTSRMGQAIAIVLVLVLAVIALTTRKILRRRHHPLEWKTVFLALIVGAGALWAVSRVSHLDRSLQRWEQFEKSVTEDARWLVDEAAISALPEAGPSGFGPGTFSVVFPAFNHLDDRAQGDWLFLHNDHLQTLMEWGWAGGLLWELLFLGGIGVALVSLMRKLAEPWITRRRQLLPLAVVALVGVGLHAVVDFPLQIASIQLYTAIYLGICWGSGGWVEKRAHASKSSPVSRAR